MALVCMAATPVTLPAQGFLEQFSYEGLRLSGLGVEMGGVVSDRLTAEPSPALRVDYGVLAPRLRVMFGASYFRGEFDQDEMTRFAQRLRRVVLDPTGDFAIEVGSITWSQLAIDGDLQYLFPAGRAQTYLGLGIGVHARGGGGGGGAAPGRQGGPARRADQRAPAGVRPRGAHVPVSGPGSAMSHALRVGVVGAGAIAQVAHLPALVRLRDVRVVGICDNDLSKAHAVASRFQIHTVYEDIEELLPEAQPEVAAICTPNHLHDVHVQTALSAGAPVLCERPPPPPAGGGGGGPGGAARGGGGGGGG